MSLKVIPPGTQRNYPFYSFRGRVDGKLREVRTKIPAGATRKTIESARAEAEQEIRAKLAASRVPGSGEVTTFRRAAELYIAWRNPQLYDIAKLDRIIWRDPTKSENDRTEADLTDFAKLNVGDIKHGHIVQLANDLHPHNQNSTKNRYVVRMVAAVLHYAATELELCQYRRIKPFREPRPKTRTVALDDVEALMMAAPAGPKRLLLLWLFRQGNRITATLGVTWEQIDLSTRVIRKMYIGKPDKVADKAMHPELVEALAAIPEAKRIGYLFPWRTRFGVYKWLRPLGRDLGIKISPHMARHTVATQLNATGASLRTTMGALDHSDVKSSIRYQDADVETIRLALSKIGAGVVDNRTTMLCTLLSELLGTPVDADGVERVRAALAPPPPPKPTLVEQG